jgi:hypothetical protein
VAVFALSPANATPRSRRSRASSTAIRVACLAIAGEDLDEFRRQPAVQEILRKARSKARK